MTTSYLIRHGSNDFFTHTLVGRKPGVRLNEKGRQESQHLAQTLARIPIVSLDEWAPEIRCINRR